MIRFLEDGKSSCWIRLHRSYCSPRKQDTLLSDSYTSSLNGDQHTLRNTMNISQMVKMEQLHCSDCAYLSPHIIKHTIYPQTPQNLHVWGDPYLCSTLHNLQTSKICLNYMTGLLGVQMSKKVTRGANLIHHSWYLNLRPLEGSGSLQSQNITFVFTDKIEDD